MQEMIFIAVLLLAQHVSSTIMPIIRSSRVLHRWSLPVVFGALVFKLSVWCGAEGYVSGLQAAALRSESLQICVLNLHLQTFLRNTFRSDKLQRLTGETLAETHIKS